MKLFANRREAGQALAALLSEYAGRPDVVVLALPRGGVPIAFEVASELHAPLDVLTVRKIGAPWNEEFAVGAIASGGLVYFDPWNVQELGLTPHDLEPVVAKEQLELARRDQLYRGQRPFPDLRDRIVILVDDGLATGATMRAAIQAIRSRHPSQVVAAAPVASVEACQMLDTVADRVVCAATPQPFYGVGLWYDDFSETSDQEVLDLLKRGASALLQVSASA